MEREERSPLAIHHELRAFLRSGPFELVQAIPVETNLRWLAGYRHPRYARAAVMAALEEVFAEPGPLRAGAAQVGDPLAVLQGAGGTAPRP